MRERAFADGRHVTRATNITSNKCIYGRNPCFLFVYVYVVTAAAALSVDFRAPFRGWFEREKTKQAVRQAGITNRPVASINLENHDRFSSSDLLSTQECFIADC